MRRMPWVVLLTAIVSLCGCGSKQRLQVAPVRGQVLYDGHGVAGATVIFHPQGNVPEEAKKMRPYAFADAEGRFELKTYVDGDGVPPGDYRVSIAFAGAGAPSGRDDGASGGPAGATRPAAPIPLSVRTKFSNVDTAGISLTIHEGQNELDPIVLQ